MGVVSYALRSSERPPLSQPFILYVWKSTRSSRMRKNLLVLCYIINALGSDFYLIVKCHP
jgi:hypothetical protein